MTTQYEAPHRVATRPANSPTSLWRGSKRLRRAGAFLGLVVLAVAIGGCGGSTQAGVDTPAPISVVTGDVTPTVAAAGDGSDADAPACHFLSEADVTTAMNRPMHVIAGVGSAVCEYAATADPSVLLALQTFANRDDASLYMLPEASSDHLSGLGDDAFWNSTLDMVFVRKGEQSFAITSPSLANLTGDLQASKAAMVVLAKIVLNTF